jgi:hypothetical protein
VETDPQIQLSFAAAAAKMPVMLVDVISLSSVNKSHLLTLEITATFKEKDA